MSAVACCVDCTVDWTEEVNLFLREDIIDYSSAIGSSEVETSYFCHYFFDFVPLSKSEESVCGWVDNGLYFPKNDAI